MTQSSNCIDIESEISLLKKRNRDDDNEEEGVDHREVFNVKMISNNNISTLYIKNLNLIENKNKNKIKKIEMGKIKKFKKIKNLKLIKKYIIDILKLDPKFIKLPLNEFTKILETEMNKRTEEIKITEKEIDFSIINKNDCSICISKINFEHKHHLRCGHVFHYRCIKPWLNISSICPNCKQSVEKEDECLEEDFVGDYGEDFDDVDSEFLDNENLIQDENGVNFQRDEIRLEGEAGDEFNSNFSREERSSNWYDRMTFPPPPYLRRRLIMYRNAYNQQPEIDPNLVLQLTCSNFFIVFIMLTVIVKAFQYLRFHI